MLSEQVRNELEAVRAIYGVRTALDYDEDAPRTMTVMQLQKSFTTYHCSPFTYAGRLPRATFCLEDPAVLRGEGAPLLVLTCCSRLRGGLPEVQARECLSEGPSRGGGTSSCHNADTSDVNHILNSSDHLPLLYVTLLEGRELQGTECH